MASANRKPNCCVVTLLLRISCSNAKVNIRQLCRLNMKKTGVDKRTGSGGVDERMAMTMLLDEQRGYIPDTTWSQSEGGEFCVDVVPQGVCRFGVVGRGERSPGLGWVGAGGGRQVLVYVLCGGGCCCLGGDQGSRQREGGGGRNEGGWGRAAPFRQAHTGRNTDKGAKSVLAGGLPFGAKYLFAVVFMERCCARLIFFAEHQPLIKRLKE